MSQIKQSTVHSLVSLIQEAKQTEQVINSSQIRLEKLKIQVESLGLAHDRSLNFETVKGIATQAENSGDSYFSKQPTFGPCEIVHDVPELTVASEEIEESLLTKLLKT